MSFRKWLYIHAREPDVGDIARRLLADPKTSLLPDYLCFWDDHLIAQGATEEDLNNLERAWDAYDAAENGELDAFMAEATRQSLERRRTRLAQKRRQVLS